MSQKTGSIEVWLSCLSRRKKASVFGNWTGNDSKAIVRTLASMSKPLESLEQRNAMRCLEAVLRIGCRKGKRRRRENRWKTTVITREQMMVV